MFTVVGGLVVKASDVLNSLWKALQRGLITGSGYSIGELKQGVCINYKSLKLNNHFSRKRDEANKLEILFFAITPRADKGNSYTEGYMYNNSSLIIQINNELWAVILSSNNSNNTE